MLNWIKFSWFGECLRSLVTATWGIFRTIAGSHSWFEREHEVKMESWGGALRSDNVSWVEMGFMGFIID